MTDAASNPTGQGLETLEMAPRLGGLLEEYGEIATILPVLAGLFITSRLQLRGSQALLVNLAVAALARQVIIQLKKQAHNPPVVATVNGQAVSQASSAETTASTGEDSTEDYTIVHSTPGRIRLRIPRLMSDAGYAKRLESLLVQEPQVLKVRLNRAAASLVIQYDALGVSELKLGLRLLQILEQAEAAPTVAYPGAEG
jgi:Heavy metal associated domain 2